MITELKKQIEIAQNKQNLNQNYRVKREDIFRIKSSIYTDDIYCYDINTAADLYDKVQQLNLDSNLFNNPYYVICSLETFDENTINIINGLNENTILQLVITEDIDEKKLEQLLSITHKGTYLWCNCWIKNDMLRKITSAVKIDEDCSPVIIIDSFDEKIYEDISNWYSYMKNPRFRIEIKDEKLLQHLYDIVPHILDDDLVVVLDDNLFKDSNPNNARNLILQNHEKNALQDKKIDIQFNGIKYTSIEQIYELEKYLEIIRSHIPSNASELDIVTYVSMFIINYFKYDYDMYEQSGKQENFDDINLTQFISSGKGVCRHFASFTKYLLNSMNIECEKVDANGDYYNNSELEGHAFNVVKINGKIYFLDNTWLAGRIQTGEIHSLREANDFLTSNIDFGHNDYEDALEDFVCESYNRDEIQKSVERVLNWNKNYVIHPGALRDLFRKHILKKEMSIDEKIENAIPRRR